MKELQQIIDILAELIGFQSITPNSAGSVEYVERILTAAGFNCTIKVFGEAESERTTNLYARFGTSEPNICFAGHLDVVPPLHLNSWKYNPFTLTQDGDLLYGRGTADMKGAVACSIVAALNFLQNTPANGSISFLLTSDEEGTGEFGTKMMLEYLASKGEKINFTILGEPSSNEILGDTINIGHRGSVNFLLAVSGKQGHVAYPHKAKNPLRSLAQIAAEITNLEFDKGNEFFDKSNLELTSIDVGNPVVNIIPDKAMMRFNVRFNNQHKLESIVQIIDDIIAKHEQDYDLQYQCSSLPYIQEYSDQMKEFSSIVSKRCKVTPKVDASGGTSDGRFIYKYSQVVELGLNSQQAHKINEHIKINDLQNLYSVYYDCLTSFLS